uniref:Uncharacterized protein n=1 Tax=Eutreptiella gymnastica TaxID=73025 RepID=A0A7S4GBY0_9EUGL
METYNKPVSPLTRAKSVRTLIPATGLPRMAVHMSAAPPQDQTQILYPSLGAVSEAASYDESKVADDERAEVPVSADQAWYMGLTALLGAGALAATAAVVRYARRLRKSRSVPKLIGALDQWAMASSTGDIPQGTLDKALKINLDTSTYGSIAEIGAGQEVGRIFFYVGASAGTIAKTISAYDMTMSDTLYGDCDRFVTLQRLEQMVDAEYEELEKTLRAERPDTRFFAFADTVVAKKYGQDNECHGWMGLKFQLKPDSAPVRVLVHARLLDKTMQEQQNALGILGTNLMHACFYQLDGLLQPVGDGAGYGAFLKGLKDDLADRIEVDFVQCDGTDLEAVDQRAVGLQLVQQGLVKAVTFTAAGDMTVPGDMLRKKAVVLTQDLDADVLPRAAEAVPASEESRGVTALQDLALSAFQGDGAAPDAKATEAFLQRMDGLKAAGSAAILSNFADYSDLATYLDRSTPEPKGVVMDAAAVAKFFAEDYTDREGGLLGYLGCVDKAGLKLMVNPSTDAVEVEEDVRPLYDYLIKNGTICSM